MTYYGIFNDYGRCTMIMSAEIEGSIKLPKGVNAEMWAGRIVLENDKPVIKYTDMDDAAAIALAREEDEDKEEIRRAEVAASKAKTRKTLTRLEFLNRFKVEERIGLRMKEQVDPVVVDLFEMIRVAEFIDTTAQTTIDGIGYLALKGYITPERAVEILS